MLRALQRLDATVLQRHQAKAYSQQIRFGRTNYWLARRRAYQALLCWMIGGVWALYVGDTELAWLTILPCFLAYGAIWMVIREHIWSNRPRLLGPDAYTQWHIRLLVWAPVFSSMVLALRTGAQPDKLLGIVASIFLANFVYYLHCRPLPLFRSGYMLPPPAKK